MCLLELCSFSCKVLLFLVLPVSEFTVQCRRQTWQMRRSMELAATKYQPYIQMRSAWISMVDLYSRKLATIAVFFGKSSFSLDNILHIIGFVVIYKQRWHCLYISILWFVYQGRKAFNFIKRRSLVSGNQCD